MIFEIFLLGFDDVRVDLFSSFAHLRKNINFAVCQMHDLIDLFNSFLIFFFRFKNVCVQTAQTDAVLVFLQKALAFLFGFFIFLSVIVFTRQQCADNEIVFICFGDLLQIREVLRVFKTDLPDTDPRIAIGVSFFQTQQLFHLVFAAFFQSDAAVGAQILLTLFGVFARNKHHHRQDIFIERAVNDDPVYEIARISFIEFFFPLRERIIFVHAQKNVMTDEIEIHQKTQQFIFRFHVSRNTLADIL